MRFIRMMKRQTRKQKQKRTVGKKKVGTSM